MEEFKTYNTTLLKGAIPERATEWMTEEEAKAFWEDHNKYVEELKAKGEYLQPYEIEIKLQYDPFYDSPPKKGSACESYRFDMLKL